MAGRSGFNTDIDYMVKKKLFFSHTTSVYNQELTKYQLLEVLFVTAGKSFENEQLIHCNHKCLSQKISVMEHICLGYRATLNITLAQVPFASMIESEFEQRNCE